MISTVRDATKLFAINADLTSKLANMEDQRDTWFTRHEAQRIAKECCDVRVAELEQEETASALLSAQMAQERDDAVDRREGAAMRIDGLQLQLALARQALEAIANNTDWIDEANKAAQQALREIDKAVVKESFTTETNKVDSWTTHNPTVQGWYWWRQENGHMDVIQINDRLRCVGRGSQDDVDIWDGCEWQGPITPREDGR